MGMTYPEKRVAIDIVDGPEGCRFTGDEREWRVLHVTSAQLENYSSFRQVMSTLAALMGNAYHENPDETNRHRELHRTLAAAGA